MSVDVLTYRLDSMGEGGVLCWRPVALQLSHQTDYMYRLCGGERGRVGVTQKVAVIVHRS